MQERIGPSYEPTKADDLKRKEAEKTNPVLFAQIQDFLYVNARADLLLKALHFLETLQAQKDLSQGVKKGAIPQDHLTQKAQEKLANAKKLLPLLQEFEQATKEGNFSKASTLLTELQAKLNDPKAPLPPKLQKNLTDAFSKLMDTKGATGQSLNTLSFQSYLGQVVVAAQGQWGSNQTMVLGSIMDKLKEMANAHPPTPFSDLAKNMLSELQQEGGSQLLQKMMQVDPKEISALLQQGKAKESAGLATSTAKQNLGPDADFESYFQELELESSLQSTMDGIEKSIKFEKEFTSQALALLQKGAPQSKELQELAAKFSGLKFPPTNDTEANSLHSFLNQLFSTYNDLVQTKQISPEVQRQFLDQAKDFCDKAINANEEGSQRQLDKVSSLRAQQDGLESVSPDLAALEKALVTLEGGTPLSSSNVKDLLDALTALQAKLPTLSPSTAAALAPLLAEIAKLSPGKGLGQLMATNQLSKLLAEFAAQGKTPKVEDLKKWLDDEIRSIKAKGGSGPLWESYIASLDQEKSAPQFPASQSPVGETYAEVAQDGTFKTNPKLPDAVAKNAKLEAANPGPALEKHAEAKEAVETQSRRVQAQIAGTEAGSKKIDQHANALYTARADVENKKLLTAPSSSESIPLPYQFAMVIFGKVIPNQNQALIAAGELLSFFNDFASGCNNIMSSLSGWSSANYDQNTWFTSKETNTNPPSNSFNVPASQAQAQAQDGMNQAAADYSAICNAVNQIDQQIAALKPPLNSQQQTRLNQLNSYKQSLIDSIAEPLQPITPGYPFAPAGSGPCAVTNLSKAYMDYTNLANYFGTLPPTQDPTAAPTSGVTGGQQAIDALNNMANDENAVNNGSAVPAGTPANGLHAIYQAISSDQSDYSGLSQQQQMQLQLTMTQTQQMFSTITSAMQDLNQAYSSIAQAVSK